MKFMIVCGLVVLALVLTRGEQPLEGCQKEDGTYMQDGDSYSKRVGRECHQCLCWSGSISCGAVQCGWPQCPNGAWPVTLEGNCCPSCPV